MKFKYPAIRGLQAKRNYYVIMLPIGDLSKLVSPAPQAVEDYYQRAINQARIPEIKKYIIANRDSYVFSALTVSISGKFNFIPFAETESCGFLEANDDVLIKLNDGQHRQAALILAAADDPSLNSETISVVVFEDNGLKRSQQMFTDLNKNAVKSSNSLSTFFDGRDPLSIYTTELISKVPMLSKIIDVEKDIIGKNSMYFFSLSTLLKANKIIVGKPSTDAAIEFFLIDFWNHVFCSILEWDKVTSGEMTKQFFRDIYILHFNVTLYAIAKLGNFFLKNKEKIDYKGYLKKLEYIDWSRSNSELGECIFDKSGKIKTGENTITLLAIKIKQLIRLDLCKEDKVVLKRKGIKK